MSVALSGGEKHTGGGRESGSDAWKQYMRRSTWSVLPVFSSSFTGAWVFMVMKDARLHALSGHALLFLSVGWYEEGGSHFCAWR